MRIRQSEHHQLVKLIVNCNYYITFPVKSSLYFMAAVCMVVQMQAVHIQYYITYVNSI